MQQDVQTATQTPDTGPESFLGSFDRTPFGLDSTQVYAYFLKLSARIQQLEEQARRGSASFVLETALREAGQIQAQSTRAAERAYDEIVRAAQAESERLRAESEQRLVESQRQAVEILEGAQTAAAAARHDAEKLREQARREAAGLRGEAEATSRRAEQELERLAVDFADFLQRMLERRGPIAPGTNGALASNRAVAPSGAAPAPFEAADNEAGPAPTASAPIVSPSQPTSNDGQAVPSTSGSPKSASSADDFRLPRWSDV